MEHIRARTLLIVTLSLVLVATLLPGCSQETVVETSGAEAGVGAALDTATGLALGTLNLEGTEQAVTEEQATVLLPLWQILARGELQGDAERDAVVRHVEAAMTEAQRSAIDEMGLTQADAQAWAQAQGQGAGSTATSGDLLPASLTQVPSEEGSAKMRDQFESLSAQEKDEMRAQVGAGQTGPAGSGPSQGVIQAVIGLLSSRSRSTTETSPDTTLVPVGLETANAPEAGPADLQEAASEGTPAAERGGEAESAAESLVSEPAEGPEGVAELPSSTPVEAEDPTPDAILYTVQAGDSLAAIARAYGLSVEAIVEANDIQDPDRIDVGQALLLPGATPPGTPTMVVAPSPGETAAPVRSETSEPAWVSGMLEQIADTDPGPPLAIEVSANRAIQDPLVEQSQTYQVTGIVRNDGDQTYALSAIHVTFFDAEGFRGYIIKYPMVPGAEWIWHGRTEADFACLLLAPDEECPFKVEITAQDMAAFLIHPDAVATGRESAPVELSDVRLIDEGTGYLRITGMASNSNPFQVQNVTVSGVLLDADGQIVSLGSTYVLEEDIEPGEGVPFELRVEVEPYASYQLYAQAERDWN